MAELALPILALGGLYIYSNSDKKDKSEKFTNMGVTRFNDRGLSNLPNTNVLNKNFPKQDQPIDRTNENYIREFPNSNQTTDKFFNTDISQKLVPPDLRNKEFNSISGKTFTSKDFTHNNMVPFFGSKVTQNSVNNNIPAILDNASGLGSQRIKKVEAAPLFKPADNVQLAHGAPIQTDFLQTRQMPATRIANVLPWEQQKVAPGLGLGYTTEGSGGFNAGMTDRQAWLPPTVDDLRSKTNPRVTYNLAGHEGAAVSGVKNMGSIGNVEKYRPEQAHAMGPQHWFTTTGSSLAQMSHPEQMMTETNNCTAEYFGGGSSTVHQGVYTKPHTEESHRKVQARCTNMNPASALGKGSSSDNDYGKSGYGILKNNRTESCNSDNNGAFGAVNSIVKGMFAPVMDVLRPSRKEDVIHNANQLGNIQTAVPQLPLTNPSDKPKTTNKEMTADKVGLNYLNVSHMGGSSSGAYETTNTVAKSQQRNFGNSETHGNIGNTMNAPMNIDAWNQQHNNVNKTYQNWPMPGGTQVFSGDINMNINRRDQDRVNNRLTPEDFMTVRNVPQDPSRSIPSAETFGKINMPQQYNQNINTQRISGDLLEAFKSNPYTQSLQSF
tara:strand:- start:203 stop:2026 length:1824 start_codon:yes stop_codon:yes gene_type:complete